MLEGIARVVEPDAVLHELSPEPAYEPMLPGVGAADALQRP